MDKNMVDRILVNDFSDIIKETVAPGLKKLGFKKSNLIFNRTVNSIVQIIRVQKSQWNHPDRLAFTVNYGFFNDIIFERSRNKKSTSKFISEYTAFAFGRIGHLIYNQDYWYELTRDKERTSSQNQIKRDLHDALLPLMEQYTTIDSFLDMMRDRDKRPNGLIIDSDDRAIFEMEFGDFNQGKDILLEIYLKAIIPKSVSSKTVYPDGSEKCQLVGAVS